MHKIVFHLEHRFAAHGLRGVYRQGQTRYAVNDDAAFRAGCQCNDLPISIGGHAWGQASCKQKHSK